MELLLFSVQEKVTCCMIIADEDLPNDALRQC